jgi:sugar (pentulose or hexulose) kinase
VEQKVVGGEHDRGIVARAVIESNSYAVKANLDQILGITGESVDSVKFCGGNSKSRLWMQIQADVLGMPVHVPEVHDGTAIGAAILAAFGSGYYSSIEQAAEEMIRFTRPYVPDEERCKAYTEHYRNWMNTRIKLAE